MLKAWGRTHDLLFVAEHEYITPTKDRRYIDGAMLHSLRVPLGYWEAKDTDDDLDAEIAKKFRDGYPKSNIIFEDSATAVLYQDGVEVIRCAVDDAALQQLLDLFFGYQRPEIANFRLAIEQFKSDLPAVLGALRKRIDAAYSGNTEFANAAREFLKQARDSINPAVTDADVREMLIQHILTEDIFARVFGQGDFHRENNVAKALYGLEQLFFRGSVKQETLHALEPYYASIRSTAALIQSHSEKQGFLKAIYENFYKVYNKKAADRLGVVYTPAEIVRFMVESADWLCEKPYNANQQNENDDNKNREYPAIDKLIKATYIEQGTAQKTKLYDMYVRFFRWASSRIEDDGILAFVSNSSFLQKNSFDGFRAVQEAEFNELWVLDLKGDARTSGEDRRRQGGNIFGDQIKVGIAIYCFVKKRGGKGFRIFYDAVRDYAKADEKMEFVQAPLSERKMLELRPDAKHNWLNLPSSEFERFIPIATKETKATRVEGQDRAIFKLFSLGISTNRDDWLYDRDRKTLEKKVRQLISAYDAVPATSTAYPGTLKWSRNLKRRLARNEREPFSAKRIVQASYRPYAPRWLYHSEVFTDELGLADELFPPKGENKGISFSAPGFRTNYCALAVDGVADLHFGAAVDGYQQVARYRFEHGERLDNITDWALDQFRTHYSSKAITKDDIFAYVYAVLHDPIYHQAYASNLKREFPRIPFHGDFKQWCRWGKALIDLHLGYRSAKPHPLKQTDIVDSKARNARQSPRVMLRSDREAGIIVLDSETQLSGVPTKAWDYRLGNRSALDWVLDQHKERQTKDVAIRQMKLRPYEFANYKLEVIDLLKRVTTVSVKTIEIVEAMKTLPRSGG